MTKERTSNERFEIVGLTKAEVDRCMEVLCGGPMPWDRGYCFASSELFARPSRCGPEPSNEGRKSMSAEPQTEMKLYTARRIGPTEPDDTMVICPVCTSQFRAIPLDVQRQLAFLSAPERGGEGFAFFRWRIARHPHIGGDASWWEFYRGIDFWLWHRMNPRQIGCE